jgi:aminoglycoside 3-N-acetyltransferase
VKQSIYTKISRGVKSVTGIKDFSLFQKKIHKRIGRIFYWKKYSSKDIVTLMQKMGMKQGSIVCIHSSMKEFYNFVGAATDLIDEILKIIGPDGTLAMPAFPDKEKMRDPNYIFDITNDRTGAGYLAETFRKYPRVKRSLNVQHSVCAIGKMADYLLNDHHLCHDCWDKQSPWYRLCESDALIFNLGMPRSYIGTFIHCVESILQYEHPYWAQFFNRVQTYRYYDKDGKIRKYCAYVSSLERRMKKRNVTRFFSSDDWQIRNISNLEIKVFYSKHCLNKMINLGRRGITIYYVPSPKKYRFE